MSPRPPLPRGTGEAFDVPRATARWASDEEIAALAWQPGDIWLGALPCPPEDAWPEILRLREEQSLIAAETRRPAADRQRDIDARQVRIDTLSSLALLSIGISDDRHMLMIAGSRAGKTTTILQKNLRLYPGSVICLDPKGENARATRTIRAAAIEAGGLGQRVLVMDPYGTTGLGPEHRCGFNPLDLIREEDELAIDVASSIAEAFIIRSNPENEHFDDSARSLLKALILFVARQHAGRLTRTLLTVHRLLTQGAAEEMARDRQGPPQADDPHPFAYLLGLMKREDEAFDGLIAAAAHTILGMGDRERGAVLSTARRNMEFLERRPMRRVFAHSGFGLDSFKADKAGVTLYLCLPPQRMPDCSRFLRLMITLLLERIYAAPGQPASGHPVLMMLEEFPVLGTMPIIEQAAGYAAGFGLKLWVVVQDLSQLKRHYRDGWETFIGNAGVVQAFANSDATTLEYLSKRLGECEITQGTRNVTSATTLSTNDPGAQHQLQQFLHGRGEAGAILNPFGLLVDPDSRGESTTTTEAWNTQRVRTPLLLPDEIERLFAREHLSELILISGRAPIMLSRSAIKM